MPKEQEIHKISDTALWVAAYRAEETKRHDSLFQDRLADVLTGERGRQIARAMPYRRLMRWALAMRTVAIDTLIESALGLGIDTVINTGAGLDTRPYRLSLPERLRWIEIDLPEIIALKSEKLAQEKPVCHLERMAFDLADEPARMALFRRLGASSKKALIITEGVIPYLTQDQARNFANDLYQIPSFQFWIQDYRNSVRGRYAPSAIQRKLKEVPLRFDASDAIRFFEESGWNVKELITNHEQTKRARRPLPFVFPYSLFFWVLWFTPKSKREKIEKLSGSVLFEKGCL